MTKPSQQALDLAVKPAGYRDWNWFKTDYMADEGPHRIALAFAEHLDKADKERREVLADLVAAVEDSDWPSVADAAAKLRANLLPDPIDPDLLEARAICSAHPGADECTVRKIALAALKRGRELAKEQDRG